MPGLVVQGALEVFVGLVGVRQLLDHVVKLDLKTEVCGLGGGLSALLEAEGGLGFVRALLGGLGVVEESIYERFKSLNAACVA